MRMLESSIQCHFGRMIHSRGGISITWSKFSAHLGIPLEEGSMVCCSTWVYVESISIHQCRNTTFSISCDFASYINFISNTIVHPSSMAAKFLGHLKSVSSVTASITTVNFKAFWDFSSAHTITVIIAYF